MDQRRVGHAARRRLGAPSSHLDMAEPHRHYERQARDSYDLPEEAAYEQLRLGRSTYPQQIAFEGP